MEAQQIWRPLLDRSRTRFVDPLYMLSMNEPPRDDLNVDIHPYDPDRDYSQFTGFTFIFPCPRLTASNSVSK